MIRRVALIVLLSVCSLGIAAGASWQKLEGCSLVSDEYGDGDSFHVRQGDKDFIFRLYFVDCPETDSRFPDRVAEQAKYFGISSGAALRVGKQAGTFTDSLLGKTFTVYTKWQDARGASKQHRFYALIQTDKGSLDSLLITNGLARIFGVNTTLPNGTKAATHVAKLSDLESQARIKKKGAWAVTKAGPTSYVPVRAKYPNSEISAL